LNGENKDTHISAVTSALNHRSGVFIVFINPFLARICLELLLAVLIIVPPIPEQNFQEQMFTKLAFF
jgi:hypothetical protein